MKSCLLWSLFLLAPLLVEARETAYQALRLAGQERGEKLLSRVIEVQGTGGDPQPAGWKITVDDPEARAGVREIEVSDGRLKSERTPVTSYAGVGQPPVLDLQKLNLDSEGVFTIANDEAARAHIGFDTIDYRLRANSDRSPIWELQLLDHQQREVGSLRVAADNGAILERRFGHSGPPQRDVVRDDRDFVDAPQDRQPRGEDTGNIQQKLGRFGGRLEKRFFRIGGKFERFFTGHDTISPESSGDDQQ